MRQIHPIRDLSEDLQSLGLTEDNLFLKQSEVPVLKMNLFSSLRTEDKLPGGKADNSSDDSFDPEELKMGIKHEMEHTNDEEIATEIAKDHLSEDPRYYSKLSSCNID